VCYNKIYEEYKVKNNIDIFSDLKSVLYFTCKISDIITLLLANQIIIYFVQMLTYYIV